MPDKNLGDFMGPVDLSNVDASNLWSQNVQAQEWASIQQSSLSWEVTDTQMQWEVQTSVQNVWQSLDSDWTFDASQLNSVNLNETGNQTSIDESVFLNSWDNEAKIRTDEMSSIWKYLRWFFFSTIVSLIWVLALVLLFSFNTYINEASKDVVDFNSEEFVLSYKSKLWNLKSFLWLDHTQNYQLPSPTSKAYKWKVNEIINALDIDYIEKKDLLTPSLSNLVRTAQENATHLDILKQEIAKQWFLPEELESILNVDQAIDTIQRSLNALEVIRFSTATKVFSYMRTALATISEMIRLNWVTVDAVGNLFNQISDRWEKDISAYVYMCYLNPFETSSNCDTIWDLDLYYSSIIKDNTINISLFKNAMSAINQLLEKEDTSLFSIIFNWFNAQDEAITFNIEVFTNQSDEKELMSQWQRNPNIFILTNIINLLKQSSFIIWWDINTKQVDVETRTVTWGWVSSTVKYSSKDFTVPIQKDTEREIFDYIDVENLEKILADIDINNFEQEDSDGQTKEPSLDNLGKQDISDTIWEQEKSDGNVWNDILWQENNEDVEAWSELSEWNETVIESDIERPGKILKKRSWSFDINMYDRLWEVHEKALVILAAKAEEEKIEENLEINNEEQTASENNNEVQEELLVEDNVAENEGNNLELDNEEMNALDDGEVLESLVESNEQVILPEEDLLGNMEEQEDLVNQQVDMELPEEWLIENVEDVNNLPDDLE